MRELKFRAWDKVQGKYIEVVRMQFSLKRTPILITQELSDRQLLTDPASLYVIEQYTGLKDKNGKEIYVGDIIRICRSYGYGFLPKGAVAVVSYDENECCYKLKKQGEFRLTSKKMVEVIGNIHENPELMKEEEE